MYTAQREACQYANELLLHNSGQVGVSLYKNLCYCRGTARRTTSLEICRAVTLAMPL